MRPRTKTASPHGTGSVSPWKRIREILLASVSQILERPVSRARTTHVAAVCYRIRNNDIEFLLVRTRAGRWTFPKGRIDDDPSPAHAAAREAYEEAGVHGYVDQQPFTSYLHAKGTGLFHDEHPVDAHLCHVFELSEAEEAYRDPTWFSVEKSKRRLAEGRRSRHSNEFERVVDQAISRIQRHHRLV